MALVLEEGGSDDGTDGEEAEDDAPEGGLLGYRDSELAHDAYCYAHDHAHRFGEVHQ